MKNIKPKCLFPLLVILAVIVPLYRTLMRKYIDLFGQINKYLCIKQQRETLIMKIYILMALVLLTTGCASGGGIYNPYASMPTSEKLWQAGHIADTLQTVAMTRDPLCYSENNGLTRRVVGRKPSAEEVVGVMALWSYTHAAASDWLESTDSITPGFKKLIRVVDIGIKVNTVQSNYSIGLTFGTGSNRIDDRCRSTRGR